MAKSITIILYKHMTRLFFLFLFIFILQIILSWVQLLICNNIRYYLLKTFIVEFRFCFSRLQWFCFLSLQSWRKQVSSRTRNGIDCLFKFRIYSLPSFILKDTRRLNMPLGLGLQRLFLVCWKVKIIGKTTFINRMCYLALNSSAIESICSVE